MTSSLVTRSVLEGYLECKYLAHLRLAGREGVRSDYEEIIHELRQERRLAITETLRARYLGQGCTAGQAVTHDELRRGAPLILDAELQDGTFRIRFDALKRVDGHSDLGSFHYVPVLFSEARNIHRRHRLLLASLGALIGRVQKRPPARGVIYQGDPCYATSIPFGSSTRFGEDAIRELSRMQRGDANPPLHINDHCSICEFQGECRSQAIRDDNLTLMRGLGEKELKRYARRGLFTLTQLSHTFRPRRPGKRAQPVRRRQYALQALAVRDRTVYILGKPELPAGAADIYLDVEGSQFFRYLLDESFSSEAAQALRARLLKNHERLFTFIEYDDVPWNSNAAENAIRRFAYFRDETAPLTREEGLRDYLILLSLFQTCRYKGINFWKFLLSEEKDIDAFAAGAPSPRRRNLDLYPPGYEPPHWKMVRERYAARRRKDVIESHQHQC